MSFDAHSLERLRQLGRTLPQPLPPPEPASADPGPGPGPVDRRHPVETETDPEVLFRELMHVSPDGSVPPHLLDRLRQLESRRRPAQQVPSSPSTAGASGQRPSGPPRRRAEPSRREEQDLYTAFQQLLLEDEPLD